MVVPNIETLELAAAPQDVVEVYLDFQRRMGFPAPPNFIKAQGHSLAVAKGTWGLVQNVLVGGILPRTLKEMMFVAISRARKCRYCEAAHFACCRMFGVDAELLQTLVSKVTDMEPPKVRDVILFGLKCATDPQSVGDADVEGLRQHGLGQAEIVEAMAMAALAVYANIIADASGIADDAMFSQL
jgi:uncharacterized peroxidase-related enzyme